MGRGRKGVIIQGNKKIKKQFHLLPKGDRNVLISGMRTPDNQISVHLPEEALIELRKMNPRDIVNIIVDP